MVKIKYDANLMKIMNLFETVTRATLKDCFTENDKFFFIVEEGQIGKAVGKGGANIKRLENILKKKIKIIGYDSDLHKFIVNLIHPLKLKDINEDDGVVTLSAEDLKTRGYLIGRGAQNLRQFETIIKRYFDDFKELKVV